MIRSFRNKGLQRFAEAGDVSKLSVRNTDRLRRILDFLDASVAPEDMNLPGFRFHQLGGSRRGTYAVDASGNYRVTFKWDGVDAIEVDLEDYH